MQLKSLVAILSVACTIGVQAAPNPLDRAAGVKGILRRSYSHGKDMSQVSKRAVALVAKKRDSNYQHHSAKHGKQCRPVTAPTTLAPEPQQSQTTPTPEQPQSTPTPEQPQTTPIPGQPQSSPIPEQPQTTPTPEQPQSTPIPEQPQSTPTPEQPPAQKGIEPISSPTPEVTPIIDVGGNNSKITDNSGSGSTSLDSVSQQWLDEHNKARALHGAPAMIWDSTLAAYALDYARQCKWEHSDGGHGENLAAQSGSMTPAQGVGMWMDEASGYSLVESPQTKKVMTAL